MSTSYKAVKIPKPDMVARLLAERASCEVPLSDFLGQVEANEFAELEEEE